MQNHPTSKDAIVIEMAERLGADDREAFEERAAIIEYDGQLPRAHAECLALLEVLRRDPLAVRRLVVMQIEIDGGTEWLLTTDLAFARAQLADIGGREVAVLDPADVIHEQYGGIAVLGTLR
jgi:AcrR family transcriptional regulator